MRSPSRKELDFKIRVMDILEDYTDEGLINVAKERLIEIVEDLAEDRLYTVVEEYLDSLDPEEEGLDPDREDEEEENYIDELFNRLLN